MFSVPFFGGLSRLPLPYIVDASIHVTLLTACHSYSVARVTTAYSRDVHETFWAKTETKPRWDVAASETLVTAEYGFIGRLHLADSIHSDIIHFIFIATKPQMSCCLLSL